MNWRPSRRRSRAGHTPATRYFENSWKVQEITGRKKLSPGKSALLIALAISLTLGGVAASVQIVIRGNHDVGPNKISLGVGHALATSCTNNADVKTDTISQYVDDQNDFVLQQLNVSQIDTACAGQTMNLIVHLSDNGTDVNVLCDIPTTDSFNFDSTTVFVFATTGITPGAIGGGTSTWGCNNFNTGVSPVLMASISATAVQIS